MTTNEKQLCTAEERRVRSDEKITFRCHREKIHETRKIDIVDLLKGTMATN